MQENGVAVHALSDQPAAVPGHIGIRREETLISLLVQIVFVRDQRKSGRTVPMVLRQDELGLRRRLVPEVETPVHIAFNDDGDVASAMFAGVVPVEMEGGVVGSVFGGRKLGTIRKGYSQVRTRLCRG